MQTFKNFVLSEALISDRMDAYDKEVIKIKAIIRPFSDPKYLDTPVPDPNNAAIETLKKLKPILDNFKASFNEYSEEVLIKINKDVSSDKPEETDIRKIWDAFYGVRRYDISVNTYASHGPADIIEDTFRHISDKRIRNERKKIRDDFYNKHPYDGKTSNEDQITFYVWCKHLMSDLNRFWTGKVKKIVRDVVSMRKVMGHVNPEHEPIEWETIKIKDTNWRVQYPIIYHPQGMKKWDDERVQDENDDIKKYLNNFLRKLEYQVLPWVKRHYPYIIKDAVIFKAVVNDRGEWGGQAHSTRIQGKKRIDIKDWELDNERTIIHELAHQIQFDLNKQKRNEWNKAYVDRSIPFSTEMKNHVWGEMEKAFKECIKENGGKLQQQGRTPFDSIRITFKDFNKHIFKDPVIHSVMNLARGVEYDPKTFIGHDYGDKGFNFTFVAKQPGISEIVRDDKVDEFLEVMRKYVYGLEYVVSKDFVSYYANWNEMEFFAETLTSLYRKNNDLSPDFINFFKYISGYKE